MSNEQIRIETSIKTHLAPLLREEGFSGSGRTFRRTRGGYVHVVNVQGSKYGDQFSINLAIHPLAVPNTLGNIPDPKKIVESECELRRRLAESGADQWWKYDSPSTLEQAMKEAAEVYRQHGKPAFEAMSASPSPIETVTANQLAEGAQNFCGFGSTKVRMALVLARVRVAEGKLGEAAAFARYGLENVGGAVSIKAELQRLAASPN